MSLPGIKDIPSVVAAKTPRELRRLMLMKNIELGGHVKFFDIQFVKGKWHAWYIGKAKLDMDGDNGN